jgi:hypothetical protein
MSPEAHCQQLLCREKPQSTKPVYDWSFGAVSSSLIFGTMVGSFSTVLTA